VSRNRFCDFLADPDSRSFSRFGAIMMQFAVVTGGCYVGCVCGAAAGIFLLCDTGVHADVLAESARIPDREDSRRSFRYEHAAFVSTFSIKLNWSFYQDMLGTDVTGKNLKESAVCLCRGGAHGRLSACRCEKRHFLRHLYTKTIILPRQARDEHRESTPKKSGVFLQRSKRSSGCTQKRTTAHRERYEKRLIVMLSCNI
jgi:hypothetical protein